MTSHVSGRPSEISVTSKSIFHIPSLDGLRAVSFLLVFFAHCGWERFIPGGLGVTVFFNISGYLITTLLRVEYDRSGKINLKNFWIRRSLRILPPFYFLLFVAYGSSLVLGVSGWPELKAFFAQALHATNYYIIYNRYAGFPEHFATGIYWSLAVEEHFYIVFPFLFLLLKKYNLNRNTQFALLSTVCALVLVWRFFLLQEGHLLMDRIYMGTDTRLDSILFGCILALWRNPILDAPMGMDKKYSHMVFFLALTGILFTLVFRGEIFRESIRYTIQGISLMGIVYLAVLYPQWVVFRWLNSRYLEFLGRLSYSLYLVHFAVIFWVADALHIESVSLRVIISFPISLLISWLIYIYIEKPCSSLRRRLTD